MSRFRTQATTCTFVHNAFENEQEVKRGEGMFFIIALNLSILRTTCTQLFNQRILFQ